jgi:hypothetical protein
MPTTAQAQKIAVPEWMISDVYWRGTIHVLRNMANREPEFRPLLQHFVKIDESSIDFFGMKRAVSSWSHSEKIMVKLAAHLFNQVHKFNLSDLDYLDSRNMKVALKAIELRYGK